MSDDKRIETTRNLWDEAAAAFDEQPDHGLSSPTVHAAWKALLAKALPHETLKVLDIGCGTGSLSVLLAELGFDVTGSDISSAMIALAQKKAEQGQQKIQFQIGDAAYPHFEAHSFDVIICRHLLWSLPEPDEVLKRWVKLLSSKGQLLLIEGFWHTGAGLHAQDIVNMLPTSLTDITVQDLSLNDDFWGASVTDERYAISAKLKQ